MKRLTSLFLAAVGLSAALLGCGSNVKLDEVPVENRTATSVGNPGAAGTADPAARAVAPVQITGSGVSAVGPVGAARVIYFDFDSYVIKSEYQSAVEAHARFMASNKTRRLAVEGHTDERGGREYNLALGQRRAEAVRQALGLLGVTDAQVEAVSFGKEKPAAAGLDEESLAKNRRAELNYR